MLHLLRKIIEWLSWLLTGLVFLAMSTVLLASRNGWEFNAILSGSMEPVLNVGGLVIFEPVTAADVLVGDIISFKLPDIKTPICHRIISTQIIKGETFFQTKGDANEEQDPDLVPTSSVTGKAIYHIPYVGRLGEVRNLGGAKIDFLGKQIPAAALVIFPVGLLFIGLTLNETVEDLFLPGKKWRRETRKIRKERLLSRKRILGMK